MSFVLREVPGAYLYVSATPPGVDPATVDDSLQGRAAALDLHPRDLLLGELLRCVEIATAAYLAGVAMAPEANRLLALRSEKVRVTTPHGIVEGTVMGIHDDYSLGLHTATGPRAIAVGDVWPVEQVSSS